MREEIRKELNLKLEILKARTHDLQQFVDDVWDDCLAYGFKNISRDPQLRYKCVNAVRSMIKEADRLSSIYWNVLYHDTENEEEA